MLFSIGSYCDASHHSCLAQPSNEGADIKTMNKLGGSLDLLDIIFGTIIRAMCNERVILIVNSKSSFLIFEPS